IVAGIVTADDRAGNFYKRIVIQDSSAAIAILLEGYNLYNDYPVGRRIYVHGKGLYLGYDGGLPVLGGAPTPQLPLTAIPAVRIAEHLVKGSTGHNIVPDTFSLAQLADAQPALYNKLIAVKDVEFEDTGVAFTQPNATTNRML